MSDELQKQAQEKLSEARRLIRDAGELAKQGQFALHFGEIGDFIPRSFVDPEILRERAIENLKREGRYNGRHRVGYHYEDDPRTMWDDIPEDEREDAIEAEIDAIRDEMEVPSEFREYGYDMSVTDRWWHPSRC